MKLASHVFHTPLAIVVVLTFADVARADGGTVRFSDVVGGYRVTVFTSPSVLRVGQADVSVLVADRESDDPLPAADVHIRIRPAGQAWRAWQPATFDAATNKLLKMTIVDFTETGTWEAAVRIDGPAGRAATTLHLDVGPPLPRWLDLAPWIFWPVVPIALFAIREVARGRRRSASPRAAARRMID